MPRFTVLRDGRIERSVALLLDEVLIGRMPGAHLELPQPSVSRRHARIRRDPSGSRSGFLLEDLGSTNGVIVGNRRVRRHELSRGDRIRIEDYEIVYEPPDDVYEAGLRAGTAPVTGPHSFSMTYVSAGSFTAGGRERG